MLHYPACERNREPILAMPANNRTLIFQPEELPYEAANWRTRRRSKQVSIQALLAFES